jgi:hypothetical protein
LLSKEDEHKEFSGLITRILLSIRVAGLADPHHMTMGAKHLHMWWLRDQPFKNSRELSIWVYYPRTKASNVMYMRRVVGSDSCRFIMLNNKNLIPDILRRVEHFQLYPFKSGRLDSRRAT